MPLHQRCICEGFHNRIAIMPYDDKAILTYVVQPVKRFFRLFPKILLPVQEIRFLSEVLIPDVSQNRLILVSPCPAERLYLSHWDAMAARIYARSPRTV